MLVPIRPSDHVDAKFAVFAIAIHILIVLSVFKVDAWGKRDKLVHVVRIKVLLDLSEAVEHLSRAHRVTNVIDFGLLSNLLDFVDQGSAVVQTKLSPAKVPPFETFVVLVWVLVAHVAVLCAAVVSHPDIVALIVELQVHGLATKGVREPLLSVHEASWDR